MHFKNKLDSCRCFTLGCMNVIQISIKMIPKFIKQSCSILFLSLLAVTYSSGEGIYEPDNLTVSKSMQIHFFQKYNCSNETHTVRSLHGNPRNQAGIKLDCQISSVIYENLTSDEFRSYEYEGKLYLPLNRTIEKGKFCISNYTGQTLLLAVCDESPITIKKCCERHERLVIASRENATVEYKCVGIPTSSKQKEWKPAIFHSIADDFLKHKDLDDSEAHLEEGFPSCSYHALNNSKDIWFMILDDGSVEIGLKFWFKPVWLPVVDNEFCVDEFMDPDPAKLNESDIDSHQIYHRNQILLYCGIVHFDDYLFHRKLFGGMCVTAAAIVFILLVIYLSIWDKQNLAGWTQFNIFVALFFVVLMEGLRTLTDINALAVESTLGCVMIAAIAQYFFFAFNTTWSVMCFDLFYMFWKLETTSKTVARYKGRLICYLMFSWGLPLLVVVGAFYFSHSKALAEMEEMKGTYAFGHRRCSSPIRRFGFQTQGIMFILNLLFFLLTTSLIWKHRRGLNSAKRKTRDVRHTWRSVTLFLKLLIVMGVTSLSIPLDFFCGGTDPLSTLSVCFRMVHFIPFVAALFIFGFNEKNVYLVNQKYPRFGRYFGFMACNNGAAISETANPSRSGNGNRVSEHPSAS